MASSNTLETRFTASIVQFENELRRLQRLNSTAAAKLASDQSRAAKQAEDAWANSGIAKALNKQMGMIGDSVKSYATIIAGMFAGKEAIAAADSWKRFSNSLLVAGVAGNAVEGVQQQLFDIAIKNGTALEPLGALYSRVTQAQKELGATGPQMIKFTQGVAAALKIQGTSSEEASGALLQLSQMMGSGIVRAEEFNSVNEGARPILEAAAKGSDKWGGSIARLRQEVVKGKVTSSEFFQAFLAGMPELMEKSAKSATTVGQAMTNIHTSLTKYIGETDAAYGVTDRLTAGLNALAANLGPIAESLKIIGMIYAATFLPALGRASVAIGAQVAATISAIAANVADTGALVARTASLYGVSRASASAAVATRGLEAAMGFFGGPVGLAVVALTVGLGYLGVKSAEAAADAEALSRSIEAQKQSFEESRRASMAARAEHGNLSTQEMAAATAAAAMTGEQGKLKDKLYLVAAAAKAAAVETAHLATMQAKQNYTKAKADAEEKSRSLTDESRRGTFNGSVYIGNPYSRDQQNAVARKAYEESSESSDYRQSARNLLDAQAAEDAERKKKLDDFKPTPSAPPASGKTKHVHDITSASEDEEAKAQKALNAAINAQAETLDQRHAVALTALQEERDEAIRNVKQDIRDKKVTEEKGDAAIALYNETYQVKAATETKKYNNELTDQANELIKTYTSNQADGLRAQAEENSNLAEHAKFLSDKQKYEQQALRLKQDSDKLEFEQQQDQLVLDRRRAGMTENVIKMLRDQATANFNKNQTNDSRSLKDRHVQERQDGGEKSVGNQIEGYARSFGSLNDQLSNTAKKGINSLSSGLTDAIMGAKSLKEAFSDMAKSIIADLIQMAVKWLIFEAIGMAIGKPGLGNASIGLGPKTAAHASGTDFTPGGLTKVGEKGEEWVFMPHGAQVVPNNLVRSALSKSGSAVASGGSNVTIATTIHANDAVLTSTVKDWIYQASIQSVQQAEKLTNKNMARRQSNTLFRR